MGGAIGDALGAPVEFWSREDIVKRFGEGGVRTFAEAHFPGISGEGLITDDTQMTLFTAEGLLRAITRQRARGMLGQPEMLLAHAYMRWYATQTQDFPSQFGDGYLIKQPWLYSQRAPGNTVMSALADNEGKAFPRFKDYVRNSSKGCGTVMRSAPFGMLKDWERGADLAYSSSFVTHGHLTAAVSSAAFAAMIGLLVQEYSLHDAVHTSRDWIAGRFESGEAGETLAALDEAITLADGAEGSSPEHIKQLGEGWIAEEALAIAVYCALANPAPDDVLDALSAAVSHDGDSDSTGAICGNLVGARHGVQALPADLAQSVEGADTIRTIADDFADVIAGIEPITTPGGFGVRDHWWIKYPGS